MESINKQLTTEKGVFIDVRWKVGETSFQSLRNVSCWSFFSIPIIIHFIFRGESLLREKLDAMIGGEKNFFSNPFLPFSRKCHWEWKRKSQLSTLLSCETAVTLYRIKRVSKLPKETRSVGKNRIQLQEELLGKITRRKVP